MYTSSCWKYFQVTVMILKSWFRHLKQYWQIEKVNNYSCRLTNAWSGLWVFHSREFSEYFFVYVRSQREMATSHFLTVSKHRENLGDRVCISHSRHLTRIGKNQTLHYSFNEQTLPPPPSVYFFLAGLQSTRSSEFPFVFAAGHLYRQLMLIVLLWGETGVASWAFKLGWGGVTKY